MAGVNKVILLGNVGKDPEVRHLESGNVVAGLTIATSEKYKDKSGQSQEVTEWHNVVVWGKLAEIVEKYVSKGNQLYVEGKIKTEKWTDKDGNERKTTKIFATEITLLGGKGGSGGGGQAQDVPVMEGSGGEDDLPF